VTEYLEIEDALQVVDRYGFHIRDIGLLASALARPATTARGVEAYPQLAAKSAALLESVARFHPLIDGNKRTAWTDWPGFGMFSGVRSACKGWNAVRVPPRAQCFRMSEAF
jgi:prophage maintenance system killer protein